MNFQVNLWQIMSSARQMSNMNEWSIQHNVSFIIVVLPGKLILLITIFS